MGLQWRNLLEFIAYCRLYIFSPGSFFDSSADLVPRLQYLRFFFKILQYFDVFITPKTAAACDDAVLHLNYIDCSLLRKLFTL